MIAFLGFAGFAEEGSSFCLYLRGSSKIFQHKGNANKTQHISPTASLFHRDTRALSISPTDAFLLNALRATTISPRDIQFTILFFTAVIQAGTPLHSSKMESS